MKRLVTTLIILIFTICGFVILGIRQETDGFWKYYFVEKMDLFISLIIIIFTCILNILEYEKTRLTGQWTVKISPQKWENREIAHIGEGQALFVLNGKRRYKGFLFLEWKDDKGNIAIYGIYELILSLGIFNKVTGTSIMKIREDKSGKLIDFDKARINMCDLKLKLSENGLKLSGNLVMRETKTESLFTAYKEF